MFKKSELMVRERLISDQMNQHYKIQLESYDSSVAKIRPNLKWVFIIHLCIVLMFHTAMAAAPSSHASLPHKSTQVKDGGPFPTPFPNSDCPNSEFATWMPKQVQPDEICVTEPSRQQHRDIHYGF